jgi:hypothetical protein
MAGVTGRQGMLTPPGHLIPPMVDPEVRVCPIPKFVLPTGHEVDDCSLFMSFYQYNLQNSDFNTTVKSPVFEIKLLSLVCHDLDTRYSWNKLLYFKSVEILKHEMVKVEYCHRKWTMEKMNP